ncbi:MAG: hypothetical protein AAGA56_30955 [Myxococcota bacterium]
MWERTGRRIDLDELEHAGHLAWHQTRDFSRRDRRVFHGRFRRRLEWNLRDVVRRHMDRKRCRSRNIPSFAAVPLPAPSPPSPVEPERAGNVVPIPDCDGICPDDDPERVVERRQLRRAIRDAVLALPLPERTLIQEHYFGFRPFNQVGQELSLRPCAASRLHRRALGSLARILTKQGITGDE